MPFDVAGAPGLLPVTAAGVTTAVIVLGPIGGIMVWARIRRDGVPAASGQSPAPLAG